MLIVELIVLFLDFKNLIPSEGLHPLALDKVLWLVLYNIDIILITPWSFWVAVFPILLAALINLVIHYCVRLLFNEFCICSCYPQFWQEIANINYISTCCTNGQQNLSLLLHFSGCAVNYKYIVIHITTVQYIM